MRSFLCVIVLFFNKSLSNNWTLSSFIPYWPSLHRFLTFILSYSPQLSGVVRHRNLRTPLSLRNSESRGGYEVETAESDSERGVSRSDSEAEAGDGDDKQKKGNKPTPFWKSLRLTNVINNFNLRAHKFSFQWDLVLYLSICMVSLVPFVFTGNRLYAIIPISIWVLYNVMF